MVLSAFFGVTLAVTVCALGIRHALRLLGIGFVPTLMWLGILEVPPPPVSRRPSERTRRAAAVSSPRAA